MHSWRPEAAALVDDHKWPEPAIFSVLRTGGPVEDPEMRRTLNLGIGFCVVVAKSNVEKTLELLRGAGEAAWQIGSVIEGKGEVRFA